MVKTLFDVGLNALSDTFESMIFQEVLPIDDSVSSWSELPSVASSVEVTTPIQGKITFIVPNTLLDNIVDDLYDFEFEDNSQVRKDLINELVNTIAGNIIQGINKKCNFKIGLPKFSETTLPAQHQTGDLLVFQLNELPCALKLDGDFISLAGG